MSPKLVIIDSGYMVDKNFQIIFFLQLLLGMFIVHLHFFVFKLFNSHLLLQHCLFVLSFSVKAYEELTIMVSIHVHFKSHIQA